MTPGVTSHMLENLSINHQFSIRVKASTVMGDGPWTREVKVSTVNQGDNYCSFRYYFKYRLQDLMLDEDGGGGEDDNVDDDDEQLFK